MIRSTKDRKTASFQKMPTKLKLKLANECEDLLSKCKLISQMKDYKFYLAHSKSLDDKYYERMMNLFEPLMRHLYEKSSWGWDRERKLSEWKHPRTRIVFVTTRDNCDITSHHITCKKLPQDDEELVGFMCFRFEIGADKDESSCYVFEIHISPEYQRQGLGEELIRFSKCLGMTFKMDKVMLTVFRSNTQALKFYNKLNFKTDRSSPSKDEADYLILSSILKS